MKAFATFASALLLSAALSPAYAQQTGNVSSLFLSNGAELDFGLYGANGGAGTNGTNSDRIAVSGQFNFSSASPGNYIVGFDHGDDNALMPGTLFTIVTFGSTNFTAADATHFTAVPKGKVSSISGNFVLTPATAGTSGTLQYQLTAEADMTEPDALWLLITSTIGLGSMQLARHRKEHHHSHNPLTPSI